MNTNTSQLLKKIPRGPLIALVIVIVGLCCVSTERAINWLSRTPTPTVDVAAVRTNIAKTVMVQSTQTEEARPTITWTPTLTLAASLTYTLVPTSTITETPLPTETTVVVSVPTVEPTQAYPPGVTGVCNDGTYTTAQHRRGACSRHGGVAYWIVTVPP